MGELATVAEPVTELKESSRSEQIDTQPSLIGWKTNLETFKRYRRRFPCIFLVAD